MGSEAALRQSLHGVHDRGHKGITQKYYPEKPLPPPQAAPSHYSSYVDPDRVVSPRAAPGGQPVTSRTAGGALCRKRQGSAGPPPRCSFVTKGQAPHNQPRLCIHRGGGRSLTPSLRATPRSLTLSRPVLSAPRNCFGGALRSGPDTAFAAAVLTKCSGPTAPPNNLDFVSCPVRRATKRRGPPGRVGPPHSFCRKRHHHRNTPLSTAP